MTHAPTVRPRMVALESFPSGVLPSISAVAHHIENNAGTNPPAKQTWRNMTTTTNEMLCECGGGLEVIDGFESSSTTQCQTCGLYSLIIRHPRFQQLILLSDFHLKRGDGPERRPLTDRSMATRLVECLVRDEWPSYATVVDFGIDGSSHLGALQFAVRSGVTAYDLDRVLGDGRAITQLVRSIPGQPYGAIEFKTAYLGLAAFEL